MNVEISNYKAELGRSGGGYMQMTTKSGTNEFHGSLYEFLRNDKLDARNFFCGIKTGSPIQPVRRQPGRSDP